ncbi:MULTISPECIES: nuclear transport factor 2 family protein [unclassified Streptomyces]|uniref:nuclear transport factor 2 family protein n=1 Tax=unclassified Streptomyces TaxID=2593676 RepID=UPI00382D1758
MTTSPPLSADQQRTRNTETLRSYFELLSARDIDAWIALWADDCTVSMPFSTGGLPSTLNGRAELHSFYAEQAANYVRLDYPGTELHPLHDPSGVLARWYPQAELADGRRYSNHNIGLFTFDAEGRIQTFTEYFNPVFFTADGS